jgi:hypothetical protein
MNIDTNKLRSTYVKGKKAYFVSDIEDQFGERPVTKLTKNKAIFKARVKDEGNSQNRRLVFYKDLQNLSLEQKEKRAEYYKKNKEKAIAHKSKQRLNMFSRIKQYYQKNKSTVKGTAENSIIPGVADISLDKIRKTSISLEKERINMTKDRIKKLCLDEGRRTIAAKKKAGLKIDANRMEYREPYLIMYSAFDRYMRIELNKLNMTLEDIGLGRARNEGNKPYIDRIAEAGQLHNLLVVAEALFQPKTNN